MKKRVFPVKTSGVVHLPFCGFLISAQVEVRRFDVIVTIYNGYSIMFATFPYRKSAVLRDPFFSSHLDEALSSAADISVYEPFFKRCLCLMALRRLSSSSLEILVDSYCNVSESIR